jgi:hypothetical protein
MKKPRNHVLGAASSFFHGHWAEALGTDEKQTKGVLACLHNWLVAWSSFVVEGNTVSTR